VLANTPRGWYAQTRVLNTALSFRKHFEHPLFALSTLLGRESVAGRKGIAVFQASDTPTSQSTAARWTFYRRLGLLLRTRLDDEGATLSLHDIAARTRGRVSADDLMALLRQGAQAAPDAVTCVVLAQAFDIDPDFFVSDESVIDYIGAIRSAQATSTVSSLQLQALAALTGVRLTAIAN
jgi:hypothetical protein